MDSHRIDVEYERAIEGELARLKNSDQPDESSLGEDQAYELFYLRSHKDRFRAIWNDLPKRRNLSVLDIGPTPFTFILNDILTEGDVATLDYTDLMADRCREAGIDHVTHDLHEGKMPFEDGRFDVVTFHGVLEHLFTPAGELFDDLARVLADDGRLLLGTPNFARLQNRVKLLIGKNPQEQIEREHVHGRGHVREYTLSECVDLVESCSLEPEKAERRHYNSFADRVRTGLDQTGLGDLPTPLDYIAGLTYYGMTAAVPSFRYHNYVVAYKR